MHHLCVYVVLVSGFECARCNEIILTPDCRPLHDVLATTLALLCAHCSTRNFSAGGCRLLRCLPCVSARQENKSSFRYQIALTGARYVCAAPAPGPFKSGPRRAGPPQAGHPGNLPGWAPCQNCFELHKYGSPSLSELQNIRTCHLTSLRTQTEDMQQSLNRAFT